MGWSQSELSFSSAHNRNRAGEGGRKILIFCCGYRRSSAGVLLAVKAKGSSGPGTHPVTAYGHTTAQRRVRECAVGGKKNF